MVTQGARGAILVNGEGKFFMSVPVVGVVDRTGGGAFLRPWQ